MKKNADGSVTLCPMCIPFSCCPIVSKNKKGSITINDDYGDSVEIKEGQVSIFVKSVNEFLSMHSSSVDIKR